MKSYVRILHNDEYYRGNDLASGNMDPPEPLEGPLPSQTHSATVEAKAVDSDGPAQEREKQIEQWMENIKSFIRKIDVSSL